ncbi:hypothetical protein JCM11957_15230 [Caminibacter profundus]
MLKLYHNALKKKEFYFIFFFLGGAKGDEWMELYLPIPNVIIYPKGKNGVFIGYFVEGFFVTPNNKKFLQDIIKRFEKTFLKLSNIGYVERIKHPPILDNKVDFKLQMDKIYSLKDFSKVLENMDNYISKKQEQIENLKIAKALGEKKVTDDALFDYMRFIAYDFVKTNGKEALTREYLEEIGHLGNEILGKTKEPSTVRAKAKSIYNWIQEKYNIGSGINNWNYKRKLSDEEYEMTRKEIALRNSKMRAEKTKNKVYKAIQELKAKGETISIKNIIKISDVGYNSAQKYLRQAREEGLI